VADTASAIYSDEFRSYAWIGNAETVHESVIILAARMFVASATRNGVGAELIRPSGSVPITSSARSTCQPIYPSSRWFNKHENAFLSRDPRNRVVGADRLQHQNSRPNVPLYP
jgi:hypothetical protein